MAPSPHAELSCTSCRRLKRKCSKDVPICSLCRKVGRNCEYPTPISSPGRQSHPPDADGADSTLDWTHARFQGDAGIYDEGLTESRSSSNYPNLLARKNGHPSESGPRFPAAWFIDSVAARGMEVPIPGDLRWKDLNTLPFTLSIGDARRISERYFQTIHFWLPVGTVITHNSKPSLD